MKKLTQTRLFITMIILEIFCEDAYECDEHTSKSKERLYSYKDLKLKNNFWQKVFF